MSIQRLALAVCLALVCAPANAQDGEESVTIGKRLTLRSEVLGEEHPSGFICRPRTTLSDTPPRTIRSSTSWTATVISIPRRALSSL